MDLAAPGSVIRRSAPTTRSIVLVPLLASLLAIACAASQSVHRSPAALGYWTGSESRTTDPFTLDGDVEVTLGAWCLDGVGFVSVVLNDASGNEVGSALVWGQGVERVVLRDLEAGGYVAVVTVSHAHAYVWELQVEDAEEPM